MKPVVVGLIGIVVIASALGSAWVLRRSSQTTISPEVVVQTSPSPASETMLEWKDQAGFSFRYPSGVNINSHPEDQENYAHLEITHPSFPGSVIVWAKDTKARDAVAWAKQEKILAGGSILNTTFANQAGVKALVGEPKKKIVTAAIDDAIVFYVEGEFADSEYWTKAYETITASFAFIPLDAPLQADAETGGEDAPADEEEMLE